MHCAHTIFNSHSGANSPHRKSKKKQRSAKNKFTRKSTGGGSELLNKFWPNFLQFIPSALQLGCETSPFLSLVGALLRTHAHTRVYISPWRVNALSFYIYIYVCQWRRSYCSKIYNAQRRIRGLIKSMLIMQAEIKNGTHPRMLANAGAAGGC